MTADVTRKSRAGSLNMPCVCEKLGALERERKDCRAQGKSQHSLTAPVPATPSGPCLHRRLQTNPTNSTHTPAPVCDGSDDECWRDDSKHQLVDKEDRHRDRCRQIREWRSTHAKHEPA